MQLDEEVGQRLTGVLPRQGDRAAQHKSSRAVSVRHTVVTGHQHPERHSTASIKEPPERDNGNDVLTVHVSGPVQSLLHTMLHSALKTILKGRLHFISSEPQTRKLQLRRARELPHGHKARKRRTRIQNPACALIL